MRIPQLRAAETLPHLRAIAFIALGLLVALSVAPLGSLLGAPQAAAQGDPNTPSGGITFSPPSSGAANGDVIALTGTTAGGCTVAGADGYSAFATGPGVFTPDATRPNGIPVAFGTAGFSTTSPMAFPFRLNFRDLAAEAGQTGVLAGAYTITFQCVDSFLGTVFQTYRSTITFSTPTAYTTSDQPPGGATATTTALAVSPASPVTEGTDVTVTATVTPANAAGTVRFKDGTTNLGDPVPVANGTAAATLPDLSVGTHSLTAVFTPTDSAAFGSSTSTAVSVQVTASSGAVATTTTMTVEPASPVTTDTKMTLTATVTPSAAAGTVQFTMATGDSGIPAPLGPPVPVADGIASLQVSVKTVGTYSLTAVFTPADSAKFSSSTSEAVSVEVTAADSTTTTGDPTGQTGTGTGTGTTGTTGGSGTSGTGASTGGALAATGASVVGLFLTGLALNTVGVGLLLAARRRSVA